MGEYGQVVAKAAVVAGMRPENVNVFADHQTMAHWIVGLMEQAHYGAGDWLFIKGSRGMRMERLLENLEQHQL